MNTDLKMVWLVWYGMVWYGMVWYGMVWYGGMLHHRGNWSFLHFDAPRTGPTPESSGMPVLEPGLYGGIWACQRHQQPPAGHAEGAFCGTARTLSACVQVRAEAGLMCGGWP